MLSSVRLLLAICTLLLVGSVEAEGAASLPSRSLVVGSEQDYPPFAVGKTDEAAGGFTVDLWKGIAQDAGLSYTLRVLPFHQLLQEFKDGRIDVLINLAQSEERHRFADFTVPHVTVHGAIFIRKGTEGIHVEQDVADKSVIVVKADIAHEYAIGKGWRHLTTVPTAADGLRLLASGQHDAMFVSKLVGMQTLQQLDLSNIKALPVTAGATQKFSFAVKKGNADLLAQLNEGLALSKSSGHYDALYNQWFSVYEEKEPSLQDFLEYIFPLALVFAAYVIVSFIRQRKAMRQLAESHHMLQTVIESIPLRVFWKDTESRYLGCNTLFARDAGKSNPADLLARADHEFPYAEQAAGYRADDLQVMTSGNAKLCYEETQTTPDGDLIWLRTSKVPLRNLKQEVIGVLGIYDDITLIKQTESALLDSEAQLKALFDNMTNGFALHEVIRDENGRVVDYRFISVNAAFERITGLSGESILSKTAREILPGIEDYWIDTYGQVVDSGVPRHLENYSADIGRWFSSYAYRTAANQFAVMVEDITIRKLGADALIESESRLSEILENVSAYIYLKDTEGRYLFANKLVRDLWGVSMKEIVGFGDEKFFDAETAANIRRNDLRVLQGGETLRTEETNTVAQTGITATYWSVKLPLRRESGEIYALCGISTDVTEVKRAQEEMLLASMVYENSSESMMVTDADGTIITINPAFTRTTGYTLAEVKGRNPRILNSGQHDPAFFQAMWQAINTTGTWQGEVWDKRKNGEIYPKQLTINTTFHADGAPYRRVALFSDITEKKKSEKLIWQQANFDHLTGLPNRRMFLDRLELEMKKALRSDRRLALLFIDLDRFKEINDTLGHDRGDMLLVEVARRLQNCVREVDTVARLGGDEFTIILGELDDIHGINRIAQCVLDQMTAPVVLNKDTAYVSASVGITLFPDDATTVDILMKNADQAMYAAKHQGRNCFSYFTRTMDEAARSRMRMSNDLRSALAEEQFWIAYQPIIELASGRIHKAEALLRWQHPTHGLIGPADFIPLAEETGLIIDIGNWVFREAAAQVAQWRNLGLPELQVSVNKSPVQFLNHGDTAQGWLDLVEEMALPRQSIIVEITEGLLLHDNPLVNQKLTRFQQVGMQTAIDGFGTGYSSLAYLRKFDIDYLKIDRNFVANLTRSEQDRALCEAIIVMAHKLDIKVVAEGVETREQEALLQAAGCDFGQGYLFSHPVPADEFERMLAA